MTKLIDRVLPVSNYLSVLGVDPGPVPGLAVLLYENVGGPVELVSARALQCSANWLDILLEQEIAVGRAAGNAMLLAVERYTPRRTASKLNAAKANRQTQQMAGALIDRYAYLAKKLAGETTSAGGQKLEKASLGIVSHQPAPVMRWCTDRHLEKAGLLDITVGCAHARSAARHALYAAVRDAGMPNPLARTVAP